MQTLNETSVIVILLISIIILLTIVIGILIHNQIKMNQKLNSVVAKVQQMYFNIEDLEKDSYVNTTNINQGISDLRSLSSSVGAFVNQMRQTNNEKIYPTPQISGMIDETIKELIHARYVLSKNTRIPPAHFLLELSKNVCMTYPHIDEKVITNKCAVLLEQFNTTPH